MKEMIVFRFDAIGEIMKDNVGHGRFFPCSTIGGVAVVIAFGCGGGSGGGAIDCLIGDTKQLFLNFGTWNGLDPIHSQYDGSSWVLRWTARQVLLYPFLMGGIDG